MFKVLSWNVLSPQLCQYKSPYFPKKYYHKSSTDPKKRLQLLSNLLEKYIPNYHFVCLQEVPSIWYNQLYGIFRQHKFDCQLATYGISENELGVMVAWKKTSFEAQSITTQRLGSIISKTTNNYDSTTPQFNKMIKASKVIHIKAGKKQNKILWVHCSTKSINKKIKHFLVGSYHMPCAFDTPYLMNTHARAILQSQTDIIKMLKKKGIDCNTTILGTDMNSTPNTEVVKIMKKKFDTIILPNTTWVIRRPQTEYIEFKDTIDYIWVSSESEFQIVKTKLLCKTKISPNLSNPSDHFPICIYLRPK